MLANSPLRTGGHVIRKGFALVVSLILLVLIGLIAVGFTGLAAIETRRTTAAMAESTARANARLALMQALGQLQRTMGPDQRVSASAELLAGEPGQPHWTGVWRSTQDDGSAFIQRDGETGSLGDARAAGNDTAQDRVMEWLVSGDADPATGAGANPAIMLKLDSDVRIEVPKAAVLDSEGKPKGHQAWWTGDLGIRANIATSDPRRGMRPDRGATDHAAWYRLMTTQAADPSLTPGGMVLSSEDQRRLASSATVALTGPGESWRRRHSLDFTVDSFGVLADVARGGLKQDLTAFPWRRGCGGLAGPAGAGL